MCDIGGAFGSGAAAHAQQESAGSSLDRSV